MKYLVPFLLFFSGLAQAGTVHSLRTNSDGSITASVKGGVASTIPFFSPPVDLTATVTPPGWATLRIRGLAYSIGSVWRLKITVVSTFTSIQNSSVTLSGFTTKNISGFSQSCASIDANGDPSGSFFTANTSILNWRASAPSAGLYIMCDIELDSKPDWVN